MISDRDICRIMDWNYLESDKSGTGTLARIRKVAEAAFDAGYNAHPNVCNKCGAEQLRAAFDRLGELQDGRHKSAQVLTPLSGE